MGKATQQKGVHARLRGLCVACPPPQPRRAPSSPSANERGERGGTPTFQTARRAHRPSARTRGTEDGGHHQRVYARLRRASGARAHLCPPYEIYSHHLVPAARCARVLKLVHPVRGGRSADRRPVLARHRLARRHAAGRGACEAPRVPCDRDARLSALHPWRFSASGPRFRLRHFLRRTCSQLLAARVVVPGERFPSLPRQRLRAAAAERHSPLRLQDRLRRRPS